jgi:dihydroorotase
LSRFCIFATTRDVELEIRRPDDWHVHLRDGALLEAVAPETARWMGRAIVMPNLVPPVRTRADAQAYRQRIEAALPAGSSFEPLMTLYLTDDTDPADVRAAAESGEIRGVKLYPAGATTNSASGVTDMRRVDRVFEVLAEVGVPLLVHGEVTSPDVDVFDREREFIERVLKPVVDAHRDLKVVLEHITTEEGIRFVLDGPDRVAGTLTAHHLVLDRNDLFAGGLRPHAYCLPVPKRSTHRTALVGAATSGHPRFFLGTDSAPHRVTDKEKDCGCAGIFSAPTALPVYAAVFEAQGALEHLEAFCSLNGPAFYGLPPSEERIKLVKRDWTPQATLGVPGESEAVKVFFGGEPLAWRVEAA